MHEVELRYGQVFGQDVMSPDHKYRLVDFLKEPSVNICRSNMTCGSDLTAKPSCHGPTAAAHLQATPSTTDAQLHEPALAHRIKLVLQESEATTRPVPTIAQSIGDHSEPLHSTSRIAASSRPLDWHDGGGAAIKTRLLLTPHHS
jgi:hypothetical protein